MAFQATLRRLWCCGEVLGRCKSSFARGCSLCGHSVALLFVAPPWVELELPVDGALEAATSYYSHLSRFTALVLLSASAGYWCLPRFAFIRLHYCLNFPTPWIYLILVLSYYDLATAVSILRF
jgi:hypothetical protein